MRIGCFTRSYCCRLDTKNPIMEHRSKYAIIAVDEFLTNIKSDSFLNEWFHPKEIKKPFNPKTVQSMAARYAMKLALKELIPKLQPLNEIYIKNKENGRPCISKKHTSPALRVKYNLDNVIFSLAHTRLLAAALVLFAENEGTSNFISCGIDIEEIMRFSKYITPPITDKGFIRLVYTIKEQEQYHNLDPLSCYATSFCCKEAVFKALNPSDSNSPVDWKEIELFFSEDYSHKPKVKLSGTAKQIFNDLGAKDIDFQIATYQGHMVFKVVIS